MSDLDQLRERRLAWWNPTEGWLAPMEDPVGVLFGLAEDLD